MSPKGNLSAIKGLTMIEVLIAAAVFAIGFTIIFSLLNQIIGKYSSKDQVIAYQLAVSHMENALAASEFTSTHAAETKSNISFNIDRIVEKKSDLFTVRINVSRAKTGKLLISLYNEKYVR